MPRNTTGGSGHRSQRNSESNKTKANNKAGKNMVKFHSNALATDLKTLKVIITCRLVV